MSILKDYSLSFVDIGIDRLTCYACHARKLTDVYRQARGHQATRGWLIGTRKALPEPIKPMVCFQFHARNSTSTEYADHSNVCRTDEWTYPKTRPTKSPDSDSCRSNWRRNSGIGPRRLSAAASKE